MQNLLATGLGTLFFALAVAHTFACGAFRRLSRIDSPHKGFYHLLGEVEAVFGFWAAAYLAALAVVTGPSGAVAYIESLSFTEPAFVFAIMVAASTRPVLALGARAVMALARRLPVGLGQATLFSALVIGPLLGSFITEPAAMTLTALLVYAIFFTTPISQVLRYAIVGTLFVNISIGGVLTHFAAPPVIMCAPAWEWGAWHMFANFGWKAALAVVANALLVSVLFGGQLRKVRVRLPEELRDHIPWKITAAHVAVLALLVALLHHPLAFLAVFVVFLGLASAYPKYQSPLLVKESFLVAVFLAGLVILGKPQQWWVQLLLARMDSSALFFGAASLTAVTDNAALTYLGTLVENLTEPNKFALLAGAVSGGGLTVIANAPNPAGYAILKEGFPGQAISAPKLLAAAILPTLVAAAAFLCLTA